MKTLRRFLHADSLRRAGRKENYGLRGLHERRERVLCHFELISRIASDCPTVSQRDFSTPHHLRGQLQSSVISFQKPPPPPMPHPVASVRILAHDPNTFWQGYRPDKIQGNE